MFSSWKYRLFDRVLSKVAELCIEHNIPMKGQGIGYVVVAFREELSERLQKKLYYLWEALADHVEDVRYGDTKEEEPPAKELINAQYLYDKNEGYEDQIYPDLIRNLNYQLDELKPGMCTSIALHYVLGHDYTSICPELAKKIAEHLVSELVEGGLEADLDTRTHPGGGVVYHIKVSLPLRYIRLGDTILSLDPETQKAVSKEEIVEDNSGKEDGVLL